MSKDLGNYDAKVELLQALEGHTELVNLVTGGFHSRVANQDAEFPRVVYTELNNRPTSYADNNERQATVNFQISVFTKESTVRYETQIVKLIDKTMKDLEYGKYDSIELYEEDTHIYHKGLRYEKHFK